MFRRTSTTLVTRLAMALFVTVAFAASARADVVTDANVAAMMQVAKTPAEYQALATYFAEKAKEATANATRHQLMIDTMGRVTGRSQQTWAPHCMNLVKTFKEQAVEYDTMANAYTKLATGSAPATPQGIPTK
jgi:hypothetical protein